MTTAAEITSQESKVQPSALAQLIEQAAATIEMAAMEHKASHSIDGEWDESEVDARAFYERDVHLVARLREQIPLIEADSQELASLRARVVRLNATIVAQHEKVEKANRRADLHANPNQQVPAEPSEDGSLMTVCRDFIKKHRIGSAETIYQTDRVIEDAAPFIEQVCDVVGYDSEDEDA